MDYNIRDYPPSDLPQYFEGSDVMFKSGEDTILCGTIVGLNRQRVILETGRRSHTVSISDILWRGVLPVQMIVYRNKMYLAGQVGARTHKKGLTRHTFGVLGINPESGGCHYHTDVSGAQREGVYNKYTNYPDTINVAPIIEAIELSVSRRVRNIQVGPACVVSVYNRQAFFYHNQGTASFMASFVDEDPTTEVLSELIESIYKDSKYDTKIL